MRKLIRYRLRLKVTVLRNTRVFEKLAVVMRPQGWIYTRQPELGESNDSTAAADLTVKGAALLFFPSTRRFGYVAWAAMIKD